MLFYDKKRNKNKEANTFFISFFLFIDFFIIFSSFFSLFLFLFFFLLFFRHIRERSILIEENNQKVETINVASSAIVRTNYDLEAKLRSLNETLSIAREEVRQNKVSTYYQSLSLLGLKLFFSSSFANKIHSVFTVISSVFIFNFYKLIEYVFLD